MVLYMELYANPTDMYKNFDYLLLLTLSLNILPFAFLCLLYSFSVHVHDTHHISKHIFVDAYMCYFFLLK